MEKKLTDSKDWTGNKASVYKTLAASNHSSSEREKNDFYATDPKAIDLLLEKENFSDLIWEPACGQGHLSKRLEQNGGGFSFLYVGGKEFIGEKDRRKPEQSKTLLQLVSEGYHLHIRGHWGDGQIIPGTPSKCRTWWNDPDNFTLIDLMTLNKFLLTNQK